MMSARNDSDTTALSRTLASTETLKLAEIHTLDAFHTPIEERFERLTRLGKKVLATPVIAITAVTRQTQWFKSVLGWHISELPLNNSLCRAVVERDKTVMIGDLLHHPRYANHPLVSKRPAFRYYYGSPLRNAHGTVIGTFCVMGFKPRQLRESELQSFFDIATLAERELLTVALQDAQSSLLAKLSIARRQAMIDPLTKTWNRRGGMVLMDQALSQARKEGTNLTVLAVDIDHFKDVNDKYGHAAGDAVLRMVARELIGCVREGDAVFRCGGDEFIVVITSLANDEILRVANRIQKNIQRKSVSVKGGKKTGVTVSIGYKCSSPSDKATAEELLDAADAELYENKLRSQLRVDVV